MFNMNQMPFPFPGMQAPFQMPQMNCMPFPMNGMQMPFPFNMFVQNPNPAAGEEGQENAENKENEENKNACQFPFFGMQMPFQMPFQMPQMNGMQMPFQMPFQMPQMNGMQMPFPPFNMFCQNSNQKEGEEAKQEKNSSPFAFFNGMMPQMNPMQMFQMFPMFSMFKNMGSFFGNNGKNEGSQNCIQMQGMSIPVDLIQKALQITASPKALEMLQQLLDFLFEMYTKEEEEEAAAAEE